MPRSRKRRPQQASADHVGAAIADGPLPPRRAATIVLGLVEEAVRTNSHPQWAAADDYRSPEMLRGAPPSPASDVFALGMVLYELLLGRRRFEGPSPWGAPAERVVGQARHLEALLPRTPPGLRDVVARALEPEPQRRYPDLPALGEALRQWIVADVAPRSAERASPDAVGRPSGAALATILLLSLIVVAYLAFRGVAWLDEDRASPSPTTEVAVQGGGQPGPTGAPRSAPASATHGPQARTPEAAVRAFYRWVERGAYERARTLLSVDLRAQLTLDRLAERYRPGTTFALEFVEVTSTSGETTVRLELVEVTVSGESRRLRGWWVLVRESGSWVLDEPSF